MARTTARNAVANRLPTSRTGQVQTRVQTLTTRKAMSTDTKQAIKITIGFILFIALWAVVGEMDYQLALLESK